MHGTDHIRHVEMRIHLLDFAGRDLAYVDVERASERRLPIDLMLAFFGQRDGYGADLAHAGADAGFFLEPDVEVGGVFRQPRHVLRGAQLADQTSGVPGSARGQLLPFQKHDVGPAELSQVVGDRAAGHAAADDDGSGFGRQCGHAASRR